MFEPLTREEQLRWFEEAHRIIVEEFKRRDWKHDSPLRKVEMWDGEVLHDFKKFKEIIEKEDNVTLNGDHRNLHALFNWLKRKKERKLGGMFEPLGREEQLLWLKKAHDIVAGEMERRGLKHESPIELEEVPREIEEWSLDLYVPEFLRGLREETKKWLHRELHRRYRDWEAQEVDR